MERLGDLASFENDDKNVLQKWKKFARQFDPSKADAEFLNMLVEVCVNRLFSHCDIATRHVVLQICSKVSSVDGIAGVLESLLEAELLAFADEMEHGSLSEGRTSLLCNVLLCLINGPMSEHLKDTTMTTLLEKITARAKREVELFKAPNFDASQFPWISFHHLIKGLPPIFSKFQQLSDTLFFDLADFCLPLCFNRLTPKDTQCVAGLIICAAAKLFGQSESLSLILRSNLIFGETGSEENYSKIFELNARISRKDWQDPEYHIGELALCRGMICVYSAEELALSPLESRSILEALLNRVWWICDNAQMAAARAMGFEVLKLALALLRKMYSEKDILRLREDYFSIVLSEKTFRKCFAYVINGWEDPFEAIQQKLKEVFAEVLAVGAALNMKFADSSDSFIVFALNNIIEIDWYRKVKYDLLSFCVDFVASEVILQKCPQLVAKCLEVGKEPVMRQRVNHFLVRYLRKHYKENPRQNQCEWWISPLCESLANSSILARRLASDIVRELVSPGSNSLIFLLWDELNQNREKYGHNTIYGLISVMKSAQVSGIAVNNALMESAQRDGIYHLDMNVRVEVFTMLCESAKATSEPTDSDLSLVKDFLIENNAIQDPDFRQRIQSTFKKLLSRLRRTMYGNWRDIHTRQGRMEKTELSRDKRKAVEDEIVGIRARLQLKIDFFKWLNSFLISAMFPGSAFRRVVTNIMLFAAVIESEEMEVDVNLKVDISWIEQSVTIRTPAALQALLVCLMDDLYDSNRKSIAELLFKFSSELFQLEYGTIQMLVSSCMSRLEGMKFSDSDQASLMLRLLHTKCMFNRGQGSQLIDQNLYYREDLSESILSKIKMNIQDAEGNVHKLAYHYPVHGHFLALREILMESKQILFSVNSAGDLVRIVVNACAIVQDVLAHESPEGNLPSESIDFEIEPEKGPANQVILNQSFRTAKASTSFLVAALSSFASNTEAQDLDKLCKVVQEAGELFERLLTTVRHRGAFSALGENFALLVEVLGTSHVPELRTFPSQWLEFYLDAVESKQVSITRRSAGLPLAITAIAKVPTVSQRMIVDKILRRLFTVAESELPGNNQEILNLPQVHASNTLRTMLQDAQVAADVQDRYGDALILAIKSFSSPVFPIRNCAAMMFSSLMTKIVGVKSRTSAEHAVKGITVQELFARSPTLYHFLLGELRSCVSRLRMGDVHPSLYPILIILARLQPALVSNHHGAYDLNPFAELVEQCAGSSIYHARDMAAKAIVPLIAVDKLVDAIRKLLSVKDYNQNANHGRILVVLRLLESSASSLSERIRQDTLHKTAECLLISNFLKRASDLPASVYLRMVNNQLCGRTPRTAAMDQVVSDAVAFAHVRLKRPPNPAHIGSIDLRRECASIWLNVIVHGYHDQSLDPKMHNDLRDLLSASIFELLADPVYEIQEVALDILSVHREHLRSILEGGSIINVLIRLVSMDYGGAVQAKAAEILLDSGSIESSMLVYLLPWINSGSPMIAQAYLPLVATAFGKNELVGEQLNEFVDKLKSWSSASDAIEVRLSVVVSIAAVLGRMNKLQIAVGSSPQGLELLFLLDSMLDDSEPEIRDKAASVVMGVLGTKNSGSVSSRRSRMILASHLAVMCAYSVDTACPVFEHGLRLLTALDPSHLAGGALFEKEVLNIYHEDVADAQVGLYQVEVLMDAVREKQIESQFCQSPKAIKILETARSRIQQNLRLLKAELAGVPTIFETSTTFAIRQSAILFNDLIDSQLSGMNVLRLSQDDLTLVQPKFGHPVLSREQSLDKHYNAIRFLFPEFNPFQRM
ncbi:putative death-receptor fusion protein-domain-containing protein [Cladochytrium replicatum]|nr:putative death-receptor fusion protein-domain-containing protein [Cladochytrium replicatum]